MFAMGPVASYPYATWNQCHACELWFDTPSFMPCARAALAHVPMMSRLGPIFVEFHG